MKKESFRKVGKSAKRLYGPRAMLVCGFAPEEHNDVIDFLETIFITDLPVIFTVGSDGKSTLKDMLSRPDQSGKGTRSDLERAVILSGITENELHQMLSAYKESGLTRPLWATLTPISEKWTLSALLVELRKERIIMGKGRS